MVINSFFKLFRKYAASILLPIALFFLITVFGLFRSVDTQTQNLNMKILMQVQSVIDNEIKNLTLLSYRLSKQDEIVEFAEYKEQDISDEILEIYQVSKSISAFNTPERLFSEIGIYSIRRNKFVDYTSAYTLEEFYNMRLSDSQKDFEIFKSNVCKSSVTGFFTGTNDGETLIYCQPVSFSSYADDLLIIGVINKKAIADIINTCAFAEELYAGIITSDGRIMDLHGTIPETLDVEKISGSTTQYKEGKQSIHYSSSKALFGRYVYILNKEALSGNVKNVMAMFIWILLAAVAVMVYMSYKNSKQMFSANNLLAENLYKEIENTKRQVLISILKNIYDDYDALSSKYNIVFDKEKICVLCFELLEAEDDPDKEEVAIIHQYIEQAFNECFSKNDYNKYTVSMENGRMIFIVNYNVSERFEARLGILERKLYGLADIKFLIGVGNEVEEAKNICLSYNGAVSAIIYARRSDLTSAVWYENIKHVEREKEFLPEEKIKLLMSYIKNGGVDKAMHLFDEIYNENFEQRVLSHPAMKNLMMKLIVLLQEVINGLYKDTPHKDEEFERIIKQIMFSNDFKNSFAMLKEIGLSIAEQTEKTESVDDLKETMLAYIHQNYSDYSISLNSLAAFMGFSYYYTSRIFRELMGLSFVKYVTIYRLEQSRRMLTETEKSIEDISGDVGFSSSNTFIKIFKKNYGVTPGQFRKNEM